MDDDWFTIEESAALLRYIFPEYPGVRGPLPSPDLREFLAKLRAEKAAEKNDASKPSG